MHVRYAHLEGEAAEAEHEKVSDRAAYHRRELNRVSGCANWASDYCTSEQSFIQPLC